MSNYTQNPKRGTGRTQTAIKAALMAALAGRRVLFITHSQSFARECARFAEGQVQLMVKLVGLPTRGVSISCTAEALSVYSSGHLFGKLQFRSTALQEQHDLNTGLRGDEVYAIVKDHHVLELEEEERRRLEKFAAMEQIKMLMDKYGWVRARVNLDNLDEIKFATYDSSKGTFTYERK